MGWINVGVPYCYQLTVKLHLHPVNDEYTRMLMTTIVSFHFRSPRRRARPTYFSNDSSDSTEETEESSNASPEKEQPADRPIMPPSTMPPPSRRFVKKGATRIPEKSHVATDRLPSLQFIDSLHSLDTTPAHAKGRQRHPSAERYDFSLF